MKADGPVPNGAKASAIIVMTLAGQQMSPLPQFHENHSWLLIHKNTVTISHYWFNRFLIKPWQ